jgi:hypothetical protein
MQMKPGTENSWHRKFGKALVLEVPTKLPANRFSSRPAHESRVAVGWWGFRFEVDAPRG